MRRALTKVPFVQIANELEADIASDVEDQRQRRILCKVINTARLVVPEVPSTTPLLHYSPAPG